MLEGVYLTPEKAMGDEEIGRCIACGNNIYALD